MSGAAAPKGRAYRSRASRNTIIAVLVIAHAVVGGILYWQHRVKLAAQHQGSSGKNGPAMVHPASKEQLQRDKQQLQHQLEAWNARARALGEKELLLHHAGATAQAGDASASTSSTGAGSTALAAAGMGACDPLDPNPEYRMRPAEEIAKEVEAEHPDLLEKLRKHAKNNEIMLTLANGIMICQNTTICWWNGGNILESFLTILKRNNVTNYLIGVMDDETERYLAKKDPPVNWFRVQVKIPEVQKKSHPANQVSTIKYTLLKHLIQLGYNILVTDMDLVYLANPFDHLHRDADIEIQTDGFDDMAYGLTDAINDPTMGWGGGGLFMRIFTTNVGCMWVKANARTFKLMQQVSSHLARAPGWDQAIFNEYLMRPSHGNVNNSYAHLRIMDINKWLNSKIFFRSRRSMYLPGAKSTAPTPILIHMNYHPDKHKRMLCLMARYFDGKVDACDKMPGGSEPGT